MRMPPRFDTEVRTHDSKASDGRIEIALANQAPGADKIEMDVDFIVAVGLIAVPCSVALFISESLFNGLVERRNARRATKLVVFAQQHRSRIGKASPQQWPPVSGHMVTQTGAVSTVDA